MANKYGILREHLTTRAVRQLDLSESRGLEPGTWVEVKPTPSGLRASYPAANWITQNRAVRLADYAPNTKSLDVIDVEFRGGDESIYDFNIARVLKSVDLLKPEGSLLESGPETGKAHCVDCGNRWSTYQNKPGDTIKCPECKSTDVEFPRGLAASRVQEEAGQATKASKQPSEQDRLRTSQAQELLQTKQRQQSAMNAAAQRDLQKKSRDQAAKLNRPQAEEVETPDAKDDVDEDSYPAGHPVNKSMARVRDLARLAIAGAKAPAKVTKK
jgi:predicted Zn-ribbon and HTH transcriptional regulator